MSPPPTIQELVVGSSAEMETKSTHPPVAVQTSPPTTIQPADASTLPLPATRDKAKWKEIMEMFDRFVQDLWECENKPVMLIEGPFRAAVSLSPLDSLESLSSDLKKDSFQSSDRCCVSRKEKALSYQHNIDFKKNPDHQCAFRPYSAPPLLDSSESLFSHPLKDVATADGDSVSSSDSGISLERKVSSGSSCESSKKREEKMSLPTIQEFVVGSSAGMETKSTDLPLFGTLHLFDRGKEMVIRLLRHV